MSPQRMAGRPVPRQRADRALLARRSQVLEHGAATLGELVRRVEADPLFALLLEEGPQGPLVRRRSPPRAARPPGARDAEAVAASAEGGSFDLARALADHAEGVEALRGLGFERARELLRMESLQERRRSAQAWGLGAEEASRVLELLEHLAACSAAEPLALVVPPRAPVRAPVARIEACEDGRLEVVRLAPRLNAVRYEIDYDGIALARGAALFSEETLRRLPSLLAELESINFRNQTLHNVLRALAGAQASFLRSGREEDLVPLTQRRLAASMGAHPSVVCRAVAGRSLLTPRGEERALADLFPTERGAKLRSVESAFRAAPGLSDREVAAELWARFKLRVSRRTIALYRSRLAIPNVYGRANGNGHAG